MNGLVSEILRGSWLIDMPNVSLYKALAISLLSGNTQEKQLKPFAYEVLSQEEYSSSGDIQKVNQVAVISMINEMTKYGGACTYGAVDFVSKIREANSNDDIKGIIIFLDGPGGNADSIPLFQSLKSEMKKPVVALVDRACSLHYWIACILADHIMLGNDFQAECGSIGAMIMFSKPKEEIIIIRPPESKDKNQGIVNALEGDYKILEDKLSILSQRFIKEVTEARPNIKDEALHGKTFLGKEAIDMGLADSIGDINKAYELVLIKSELSKL